MTVYLILKTPSFCPCHKLLTVPRLHDKYRNKPAELTSDCIITTNENLGTVYGWREDTLAETAQRIKDMSLLC